MSIDPQTVRWWTLLRSISGLNLMLWLLLAIYSDYSVPNQLIQVMLSGIYTLVCAFRSFYPRVDLERTVLVDHWLSSIALGRSAATIAEMSFTIQIGLVIHQYSGHAIWLSPISVMIIVIIAIAQLACWCGVLTGSHRWHAVEETLWAIMVLLIMIAGVGIWPAVERPIRALIVVSWIGGAAAIYVMCVLDVPMYLNRWRDEQQAGKVRPGLWQGFVDAWKRREPTGRWLIWKQEVNWMTPYFTLCVWLSLAIAWFAGG